LVEYLFDGGEGDYNDTSGDERHGIPGGTASVSGGNLVLDGSGWVDIPVGEVNPFDGHTNYSIEIRFSSMQTTTTGLLLTSGKPSNVVGDHPILFTARKNIGGGSEIVLFTDAWFVGCAWSGTNVNYLDGDMHTGTLLCMNPDQLDFAWYSDGALNPGGKAGPVTMYEEDISTHVVRT
jgi:hypothetical protein